MRTVLFLCSGNYYRSRYAEETFNDLAGKAGLHWRATSRALALEMGRHNVGPVSAHTRAALAARGTPLREPVRFPAQCSESDLTSADRVVALKEAEHRPHLTRKFPDWPDRVDYWHVHDLDGATPDVSLAQIDRHVAALVQQLVLQPSRR